jgi:ubiquinone/menaquinone biosynthesis C-methylase UbiE
MTPTMFDRLHIGPGKTYLPGWINVDIFSNVKADIYASALALPYPADSFNLIYASHILEHFNRHMVLAALTHWRHLLKEGGILRLSVPNFYAICLRYMRTNNLEELQGLLYGGQLSLLNNHCVVFDNHYLKSFLMKVGFSSCRKWDWKSTDHAEFDDYSQAYLPHMDKDNGMLMSLNVEAIK